MLTRRNQLDISNLVQAPARRAFTMVDLLVSIAVIALLIGLITPTLAHVKGAADKVVCASNLRQVGLLLTMYADDHDGMLPEEFQSLRGASTASDDPQIAHTGEHPQAWSGLGWLVADGYLNTPEVFYCPAHEGVHTADEYAREWVMLNSLIRTNYAYRDELARAATPHIESVSTDHWATSGASPHAVLVSDGFASADDLNHDSGFNTLTLSLAVSWVADEAGALSAAITDGRETTESWSILDQELQPDSVEQTGPAMQNLLLGW